MLTINGAASHAISRASSATRAAARLGRLVVTGGATQTLSGINTFTGGVRIEAASTLALGDGRALGSGAVDLAGGTLRSRPRAATGRYWDGDAQGAQNAFNRQYLRGVHQLLCRARQPGAHRARPTPVAGRTSTSPIPGVLRPLATRASTRWIKSSRGLVARFICRPPAPSVLPSTSDDGTVVFIDGVQAVNNNFWQGMTTRGSGDGGQPASPVLSAGYHTFDAGFYEGGGGAGLILSYRPSEPGRTS